jgi:hypothetical protein
MNLLGRRMPVKALGKCLRFHLKYMPEMQRLYWAEEKARLDGLQDIDQVLRMVKAVGDAACEEAADFLETCAESIEEYLREFSSTQRVSRRDTVIKYWAVECRVKREDLPEREFYVGVSLPKNATVVPWVWCRGGHRVEDQLAALFAHPTLSRSGQELVSDPGTVALNRFQIILESEQDSVQDFDRLVSQVVEEFKVITPRNIREILGI